MWKKFLRKFRSVWVKVEDEAGDIWDDVEPALLAIVDAGGKQLLTLAYQAVQIAEKPGVSGEDKRKEAKKLVLNGLKEGVDNIVDQTINLAIEVALAKLKSA